MSKIQTTKRCKRCKTHLPLDAFTPCQIGYNGHQGCICKVCDATRKKSWYLLNKEYAKAKQIEWRQKLKREVFEVYGLTCACCDEPNMAFLTIDHVNNDGAAHRKELGCSSGAKFYYWLKTNNWPRGFQTLCFNCNLGKYQNGGICPHKGLKMSKFEQSTPQHEVHEIPHSHGHGYLDQKHQKGMRSPAASSTPVADQGAVPSMDGAGSPGMPNGQYGPQDVTGS